MSGARLAPPRVPSGQIVVNPPPELSASDGTSIVTSLLPLVGVIGSIVMVVISGKGIAGILTAAMFLISSLGFVLVNGWRQRSQRNAQLLASRREYLAYLTELRETVRVAAKQQRKAANWSSPAPAALPYLAEERTRVWERSAHDADFLFTRLGTMDQPLCLTLQAPELPPLAQLDPVSASAAHRFMLTHEIQRDLPFAVPLNQYSRLEITGDEQQARSLARALITSIATLQSPIDVQIAILAAPQALPEWEWAKWLPHTHSTTVFDDLGQARMIVSDLAELETMLPKGVRDRGRFSPGESAAPHLVILTDGVSAPALDPVFARDGLRGVTIIDVPTRWDDLDLPTALRIACAIAPTGATADLVTLSHPVETITPDVMTIAEAEATARRLLGPYQALATADGATDRPAAAGQLELVDLLGLPDVRELDFSSVWRVRPERDRLRVPIGQTTTGAPLYLDLKESAQQGMGPHGVMIGATGSGKSEVLRTLVLALALTHSPEQLNFVLVDFKGGATFAGMAGMPHVSAIITNLGDEIALVDRFQDALQGELTRRQELLRASGNFANVLDYEKARRSGRSDLAPLPALLIVADEFSELLAAKPEFIESFINIGRVGRSLQVHLLLASQRLEEGKLRGLDTYLSYRVGLRTFSAAESRTVLGVPDAYTLPQQPGVGILKSDTETLTQFRAAYVSGPPSVRRGARGAATGSTADAQEISIGAFTAAAVRTERDPAEEATPSVAVAEPSAPVEKRSTFDLAVDAMRGLGPAAHAVWLDPLDVPPTLDELIPDLAVDPAIGLHSPYWRAAGTLTVPLGIVDVPLEQRREHLTVQLDGAGGHVAIVGGPLAGKSTLARTLTASLALTHSPREVQFYVLDFGGGSFAGLKDLPHLAGLATRSEPEVVRRAVSEVLSIIDARERYFVSQGVDSMETYRRRRAAGTAEDGYGDIFLVIDGWSVLRSEFENLETVIQSIAARGLTYGVHVVITASRWLEIRTAVKDLIGTRLELRLGDPSDSEVDRKAAANVTAGAPGRGLSPRRLQMLAALPRIDSVGDAASLSDGVQDLVARVTAAAGGQTAPKLRLLPQLITLDEVRALKPTSRELLLGVDEASIAPIGLDLVEEPHLMLYGDSQSGKTSFIRSYAAEIARLYPPSGAKIFVVDYRRKLLGDLPEEYVGANLSTHESATSGIQELVDFFRTRIPGDDVTPEQLRTRSWWTGLEGFIIVDDYDLVSTSQGNPLAPLAALLPQAHDLGLHLIVARRTGGASRAAYDPIIQRFTDIGTTGILLSGSPEEGAILGKVKAMPSVPGRAQIVSRKQGVVTAQLGYVPSKFS